MKTIQQYFYMEATLVRLFVLESKYADEVPPEILALLVAGKHDWLFSNDDQAVLKHLKEAAFEYQNKIFKELFKYVTPEEYAMLCEAVYNGNIQDRLELLGLADKFELVDFNGKTSFHSNGFDAAVFHIKKTNHYIFAIRGTSELKDFIEDFRGVTGASLKQPYLYNHSSFQLSEALNTMSKVLNHPDIKKGNLVITGHSLGAWLSTVLSNQYKISAVNFSTPHFTDVSKPKYLKNDYNKVIHFCNENDVIASKNQYMNYVPGIRITVPPIGDMLSVTKNHGVANGFQFDKQGNILTKDSLPYYGTKRLKGDPLISTEYANYQLQVDTHTKFDFLIPDHNTKELQTEIKNVIPQGEEALKQYQSFETIQERYIKYEDGISELEKEKENIEKRLNKTTMSNHSLLAAELRLQAINKEISELRTKSYVNTVEREMDHNINNLKKMQQTLNR